MHGDWVVAAATLMGAIIGAVGIFAAERFRSTRSRLRFYVHPTQDIATSLRAHAPFFEIKVGDVSTNQLVLSVIEVENAGNTVLKDFSFDATFSGGDKLTITDLVSNPPGIARQVVVRGPQNNSQPAEFTADVPFLNPQESFEFRCFYDGASQPPTVDCRLPGVVVRIFQGSRARAEGSRAELAFQMLLVLTIGLLIILFFSK